MAQRLLLDTQTAVWAVNDDKRLGKKARRTIVQAPVVAISTISIVELEMIKLFAKSDHSHKLDELFSDFGYEVSSFDAAAANQVYRFGSLESHDPFDRLILAHAASTKSEFLTSDRKLIDLGFDWIVDSRD